MRLGLLDALRIKKAHIVGASMGGMIGQLVAANHPGEDAIVHLDHVHHRQQRASAPEARSGGCAAEPAPRPAMPTLPSSLA